MKFKIKMVYSDYSEVQDEVFDTEEAAEDYAQYLVSCSRTGAEVLSLSNPGDDPYDPDTFDEPDYEIFEVEE